MSNNTCFYNIPDVLRQEMISLLHDIGNCFTLCNRMNYPSLFQGNSGISLFWAQYYLFNNQDGCYLRCHELLDQCIDTISSTDQLPALSIGFTGVAWLISYYKKNGILPEDEADDMLEDINAFISHSALQDIRKGNYDAFTGVIGTAKYLMDSDNVVFKDILPLIRNFLSDICIKKDEHNIFWTEQNSGIVNLGLAHGIPSILCCLLRLEQEGYGSLGNRNLLYKSINWLLDQKDKTQKGISQFPGNIASTESNYHDSRLAWCYGDLGIAFTLYKAANILKNSAYFQEADNIVLGSLRRNLDTSFVSIIESGNYYDPTFCHGLSGILFTYQRLATFNPALPLQATITYWLSLTLDHTRKKIEYIKSKTHAIDEPITGIYVMEGFALLDGLSGIGLVLLSFLSPARSSGWQSLFSLD